MNDENVLNKFCNDFDIKIKARTLGKSKQSALVQDKKLSFTIKERHLQGIDVGDVIWMIQKNKKLR